MENEKGMCMLYVGCWSSNYNLNRPLVTLQLTIGSFLEHVLYCREHCSSRKKSTFLCTKGRFRSPIFCVDAAMRSDTTELRARFNARPLSSFHNINVAATLRTSSGIIPGKPDEIRHSHSSKVSKAACLHRK